MSILSDLKLFSPYTVTLEFTVPCIGGIPNAKNLIEGWLKTKNLVATEEELKALVEATAADLGGKVEEKASAMWTTFKRNDKGIYLEGRQVKAMLKEAANILRDMLISASGGKTAGKNRFTNLASKVAERLHIAENEIYFTRDGKNLMEPDGSSERPIHVKTAMGPRTALKRTDYVNAGTRVSFTAKLLNDPVVDLELLQKLLEFSQDNGLGADRSQSFGKFTVVGVEAK